jgi:hypothetical protein
MGQCLRSGRLRGDRKRCANIQYDVSVTNFMPIDEKHLSESSSFSFGSSSEIQTVPVKCPPSGNLIESSSIISKSENFPPLECSTLFSDSKLSVYHLPKILSNSIIRLNSLPCLDGLSENITDAMENSKCIEILMRGRSPSLTSISLRRWSESRTSPRLSPNLNYNPGRRLNRRLSARPRSGIVLGDNKSWNLSVVPQGFRSKPGIIRDLSLRAISSNSIIKCTRGGKDNNEQENLLTGPSIFWKVEPIRVSVFGNLTLTEPLRLLSSDLSCSLRLTNMCFELLYDQGDSVQTNSVVSINQHGTQKKTLHRSSKAWISGSVTVEPTSFTLHPSKLIVSVCGVENGLTRKAGGLFGRRLTSPPDLPPGNRSTSTELASIPSLKLSSSSAKTLTSYWFSSDGFFLNSSYNKEKVWYLDLFQRIFKNRNVAGTLWMYMPESIFKDRTQYDISAKQRHKPKLKDDDLIFKPFSVVPFSRAKMRVENIDLELYVCSNWDGVTTSISLSILNDLYMIPDACDVQNYKDSNTPEVKILEEIRPKKLLSLGHSQKYSKEFTTPKGKNLLNSLESISQYNSLKVKGGGGFKVESLEFIHVDSFSESPTKILENARIEPLKLIDVNMSNVSNSDKKFEKLTPSSKSLVWNLICDFEYRIMEAILEAISSRENECRSKSAVRKITRDSGTSSSLRPVNSQSQGTSEVMENRMTIFLRPEGRSSTREDGALSQLGSQSYDDNDIGYGYNVSSQAVLPTSYMPIAPDLSSELS